MQGVKVVKANAFSFLQKSVKRYDLIFADPPYELKEAAQLPDIIFDRDLLAKDGLFILEHSPHHSYEGHPHFAEHRVYGLVNFSFFK